SYERCAWLSTPCPFPTLFRSADGCREAGSKLRRFAAQILRRRGSRHVAENERVEPEFGLVRFLEDDAEAGGELAPGARSPGCPRSEEHTSELQSRENLVFRLL